MLGEIKEETPTTTVTTTWTAQIIDAVVDAMTTVSEMDHYLHAKA